MRSRRSRAVRRACLLPALLLGLSALPVRSEEALRLVYDWSVTTAEPDGSGAKTMRGTFVARLTPTTLAVREGDREEIYDFSAGRIAHLDHIRVRRESSLYTQLDFTDVEIQGRRMTGNLMSALLGKKHDLVDDEIDLGVTASPPAPLKLRERKRDGKRNFLLNGRERTSFVASDAVLPPSLVPDRSRRHGGRAKPNETNKQPIRIWKRLDLSG